jgi:hypothetical protein
MSKRRQENIELLTLIRDRKEILFGILLSFLVTVTLVTHKKILLNCVSYFSSCILVLPLTFHELKSTWKNRAIFQESWLGFEFGDTETVLGSGFCTVTHFGSWLESWLGSWVWHGIGETENTQDLGSWLGFGV